MEFFIINIICLIIMILVCVIGIKSFDKGTSGRENFIYALITSFIPTAAIIYVFSGLIILFASLFMWFISKLAGTD